MAQDFTSTLNGLPSYTPAQMLKAVNQAIVELMLGAQEWTIGERTFRRSDLADLKRFRSMLIEEVGGAGEGIGRVHLEEQG